MYNLNLSNMTVITIIGFKWLPFAKMDCYNGVDDEMESMMAFIPSPESPAFLFVFPSIIYSMLESLIIYRYL